MQLNPLVLIFWLLCTCVGFLFTGAIKGAVMGLTIGLTMSIISSMFSSR